MDNLFLGCVFFLFVCIVFSILPDVVQLFGGLLLATYAVVFVFNPKGRLTSEDDHYAQLFGMTIALYGFVTLPLAWLVAVIFFD
jgi:hypothetical protein